ncbi:MAG: hypothetical protein NT090_15730 [Acidobacteria bacterium]|nr:hypothetical protein [Acidobacteriota bacterium]
MRFCTIIAVLAAAWVAYAPGGSKWRKLGPGGGGALFYPTISPHNAGTVLVGCDMTGSYISRDAGESWRMFNLRSRAAFFAFDPVNPRVMYAGARGLFQSADGGETWNLIFPEPAKVTGIWMPDDHAGALLVTKDGTAPQVSALGLDPADPNTLYLAAGPPEQSKLYLSSDGGRTWKLLTALAGGAQKIHVDPASPPNQRTLYAIGTTAVAIRESGLWKNCPAPSAMTPFRQVSAGFPPQGGRPVIYALGPAGLVISRDGGKSWAEGDGGMAKFFAEGALPPVWRAVGTCLTRPEVAVSRGTVRYREAT